MSIGYGQETGKVLGQEIRALDNREPLRLLRMWILRIRTDEKGENDCMKKRGLVSLIMLVLILVTGTINAHAELTFYMVPIP